ncbi:DUF1893 domain-containing protein [candidate division KSB1 bacterium]|nr:DUF1893 domain-containing protein [candidate division KSB1 bacterium]
MTAEQHIQRLKEENLSLIVEKHGKILYQSAHPRLEPLFRALQELGEEMAGALIIDKVIGAAAARLAVIAKVSHVITPLTSRTAVEILQKNAIKLEFVNLVDSILNRDQSDLCPMEKMAKTFPDNQTFYEHLKSKLFV